MATSRGKPLADWTDGELSEILEANARQGAYSQSDLVDEANRRRAERVQRSAVLAAWASAIAAGLAALAALLVLVRG